MGRNHHIQAKALKLTALLFQALLLFAAVGCMPDGMLTASSTPVLKVVVSRSDPDQTCRVDVTINRPGEDLDLEVEVDAEKGIIFNDTGNSVSNRVIVHMYGEGRRKLNYPCRFDTASITRSGAYMVRAKAVTAASNLPDFNATTKLYVYISEVDGISPRVVSEQKFMEYYPGKFKVGTKNIGYQIALGSDPQPQNGKLYVKVNSPHDQFAPYLTVDARGGLEFVPDASMVAINDAAIDHAVGVQLQPILAQGSRILVVPFRLIEGSFEGDYPIEISEIDGEETHPEYVPFLVQIASAPEDLTQKWLVLDPNFIATHKPETAIGSAKVQSVQPTPIPPSTVETPPQLLPPTVPPAPTAVNPDAPHQPAIVWDIPLQGYYGNRWQVYETFIRGKIPIPWETFKELAVAHNPELIHDGYIFQRTKQYLLPRVNPTTSVLSY